MKLYFFALNKNKVSCKSYDVAEKGKTKLISPEGLMEWKRCDLDFVKTDISGQQSMYSLNGDVNNFIHKIIEQKEQRIKFLRKEISELENEIVSIRDNISK